MYTMLKVHYVGFSLLIAPLSYLFLSKGGVYADHRAPVA